MVTEMQKKRRLSPPIVAAALIVLLGASFWPWRSGKEQAVIRASGTIEATQVIISPKVSGRICALNVDEGSVVGPGDVIAQLDTNELGAQVAAARAALARATDQWQETRNGNRPQQIGQAQALLAQADANVAGAYSAQLNARKDFHKVTELKSQLDSAKTRYDALVAARVQQREALRLALEGTRKQQIEQARAALAEAQVVLAHDQSDYDRYVALYQGDAISRQQLDAASTTRDAAQKELDQAKAHFADLAAGSRPQEIREAQMVVSQADANLDGARLALQDAQVEYQDRLDYKSRCDAAVSSYQAALAARRAAREQSNLMRAGSRIEDLHAAEQGVREARGNLDFAIAQYAAARVISPIAGVVDTKVAELGEVLNPGAAIVTLYDLDHVWLRVYVPEALYGRVRIGESVRVTVDSYPHAVFRGVVAEIASDAEFTPKSVQTEAERVELVYGVKVDIDNRDHRLKPGMPGDATFAAPQQGAQLVRAGAPEMAHN